MDRIDQPSLSMKTRLHFATLIFTMKLSIKWWHLLFLAQHAPLTTYYSSTLPVTEAFVPSCKISKPLSLSNRVQLSSTNGKEESYDDDDDEMAYPSAILNPVAVPPDTPLVLGINKYSHDVSVCAADQNTGKVLFYLSKERITRKKHDAGSAHTLVDKCLECLELDLDNIKKIVVNNHHHRVLPIEQNEPHVQWQVGLGVNDNGGGFGDEENLLLDCENKVSKDRLIFRFSETSIMQS